MTHTPHIAHELWIDVALAMPLHSTFTYRVARENIPESWGAPSEDWLGRRVVVPFRKKTQIGIVWNLAQPPTDARNYKVITRACDDGAPVLTRELRALCTWISEYYAAPIGEVCRAALPHLLFTSEKMSHRARRSRTQMSDAQIALPHMPFTLTPQQARICEQLTATFSVKKFHPFLLHGVTGSGKTEIYLDLIAKAVERTQSALLLIPEIGLAAQLLKRLQARFGERVALYHSGLTDAQRFTEWMRMWSGDATICCGTRSALFAPLQNLGVCIADEEHDHAYKQEEEPRYHGRDTLLVRAKSASAVALLGSATPSFESMTNVQRGKFTYLHLPTRPGTIQMPRMELIDLRSTPVCNDISGLISTPLRDAITAALAREEQILLFQNRRGFAAMLQCRACGFVCTCPNCDVSLTLHRRDVLLRCHLCDHHTPRPTKCAQCASDRLKALGSGTERIAEAIAHHFPTARLARMDRDTAGDDLVREAMLTQMHQRELDILIGTQMIAKGHDFPRVTVVGVILADQSLYMPDFRAAERTFQILAQVAGRAGRQGHPATVYIQTYVPEHYSLQCARDHDLLSLHAQERAHRHALHYPPYGKLINVRFSGLNAQSVSRCAHELASALAPRFTILGPAPATHERVANRYRWHLLIKCAQSPEQARASHSLVQWVAEHAHSGVHIAIDVDPVMVG